MLSATGFELKNFPGKTPGKLAAPGVQEGSPELTKRYAKRLIRGPGLAQQAARGEGSHVCNEGYNIGRESSNEASCLPRKAPSSAWEPTRGLRGYAEKITSYLSAKRQGK